MSVAVEKMQLMNLVMKKNHVEPVLRTIVRLESVQVIDAGREIDNSHFLLNFSEKNMDEIAGFSEIQPVKGRRSLKKTREELSVLMKSMNVSCHLDTGCLEQPYSYEEVAREIDDVFNDFQKLEKKRSQLFEERKKLKTFHIVKTLEGVSVDLKALKNMEKFSVKWGTLTKENRKKFVLNYENVPAIAIHIGTYDGQEAYIVVCPKSLKMETDRILRSVYFQEIEMDTDYLDWPEKMIQKIQDRIRDIDTNLESINQEIREQKNIYEKPLTFAYSRTIVEEAVTKIRPLVPTTPHFAYLCGWVSERDKSVVQKTLEDLGYNMVIEFSPREESELKPPTKLKNHWLVSPFEALINMYGIPSYNEVDPTVFMAITYMILFGAMFGDLGQGLIIFLVGLFLAKKKNQSIYGGILSRLGVSSMIFGWFYDSFFGYEHILSSFVAKVWGNEISKKLFLRPIENINTMLFGAVILGLVLLFISYGYSIYNKLKINDIKEGLWGRHGVAGLVLYISIIMLLLSKIEKSFNVPSIALWVLVAVSIGLIIFREPLTNIQSKKRPLYDETAGAYYVESGFDIFETFLSMLSNTVSFIRVGAFALNHVGLFIAFHTMANIIGNITGHVILFFLGNAIVIFLEGLIVFIQGLRLVYYELFSKYYTGEGVPFQPERVWLD